MDSSPNLSPLDGRTARARMACDQQHNPLTRQDCGLQTVVDCGPRLVERQAVKIEHSIRLNGSGAQLPVPA